MLTTPPLNTALNAAMVHADNDALKRLDARRIIRPSAHALQVVVGPSADLLAQTLRDTASRRPRHSGSGARCDWNAASSDRIKDYAKFARNASLRA